MQDSPVRLDKWLWAARFFKTRGLAREAVEGGKVHVDGARAKPSRQLQVGVLLRIRVGHTEWTVRVEGLSDRRGPATVARQLYSETPDSAARREREAELRRQARLADASPAGRPDKKDRRHIRRFKQQWGDS